MTRCAVGVVLGLLIAPVVAQAQTARFLPKTSPTRAFSNLTFGQPAEAPDTHRLPLFNRRFTPAPSTEVLKAAPEPMVPPDCTIIIIPADPSVDPRMPVKVDERLDPRFFTPVVPCREKGKDIARPPR